MTEVAVEPRGVSTRPAEPRSISQRTREAVTAYAMLAPALVIFGWFAYWPFWNLIHLALYQQNQTGTRERWVGPSQIVDTLGSTEFAQHVGTTFLFLLFSVPLGVVLGVLLATSAHRRLRGIRIFQVIFSSTIASSVAVAGVVFFTLVNPELGYFRDVSWLSLNRPLSALFAVSLSATWQNLGLTFVIVLAGLQSIPDELYEAATLDGFSAWRRFRRITIPMLSPTLMFLAVVLAVRGMQAYAEIELLTNGAPGGRTETLLFRIVQLQAPADLGRGAALSLGLFVITMLMTGAQFLILNRRVHYGD